MQLPSIRLYPHIRGVIKLERNAITNTDFYLYHTKLLSGAINCNSSTLPTFQNADTSPYASNPFYSHGRCFRSQHSSVSIAYSSASLTNPFSAYYRSSFYSQCPVLPVHSKSLRHEFNRCPRYTTEASHSFVLSKTLPVSYSFGVISLLTCFPCAVNLAPPTSFLSIWPFGLTASRFSKHPYKPKSRQIFHPHMPGPEHLPPPRCLEANLSPMQTFIPVGYYSQKKVECLRSGQYLGEDAPYSLVPNWRLWKRRKYNVECKTIPWKESSTKAVLYYERLNMWAVQWKEDGVHRVRRFKGAYGLKRGRLAAEKFRMDLEACGRVDNRRTERQLRMQYIKKKAERDLRRKRFKRISSGQF